MGGVICGKCGKEYPDSEPLCPKCGEPFRLNSLSVKPPQIKEESGTATPIGSSRRVYNKSVNINLKIPGKAIAVFFMVVFALALAVLNLLLGWLAKK